MALCAVHGRALACHFGIDQWRDFARRLGAGADGGDDCGKLWEVLWHGGLDTHGHERLGPSLGAVLVPGVVDHVLKLDQLGAIDVRLPLLLPEEIPSVAEALADSSIVQIWHNFLVLSGG